MATEVATMWISSDSLLGAMHTMLGRLAMKVTSNAPQWVAPSAPTRPARSIAKRTGEQGGREGGEQRGREGGGGSGEQSVSTREQVLNVAG